ncbi:alpha/beta hydrolase [Clostridium sp. HBUAS56017]|uniref:serine aminopeptidase domain-containing protein n=1 Tax=Clostridium sp. HBUAS56017 TaxID=2571128 RepID=UPI001FA9A961|nr:alpha/beta hydrolase [Clostridium sp. HBUAS56017]
MAEHSSRYDECSEYLNINGFIVYAFDHRGHGKTTSTIEETSKATYVLIWS